MLTAKIMMIMNRRQQSKAKKANWHLVHGLLFIFILRLACTMESPHEK